jgi:hypothetical protein
LVISSRLPVLAALFQGEEKSQVATSARD